MKTACHNKRRRVKTNYVCRACTERKVHAGLGRRTKSALPNHSPSTDHCSSPEGHGLTRPTAAVYCLVSDSSDVRPTGKQEGRVVAGDHRAMRGTCTKSLHLIVGQCIEWKRTLKLSANIRKLSKKTTLQVHQWRTNACRRMVSRDPGPKFTKFGGIVSIVQTPITAKFCRATTKSVRDIRCGKFCFRENRLN